jgi:hypothetical protein
MLRTLLIVLFMVLALIMPVPIPAPVANLFASRPVAARAEEDE